MGQYTTKGLYNKYDKNHKERAKLDYYATPPGETLNILQTLDLDFSNLKILEPAAGGGHMLADIYTYTKDMTNVQISASDIHAHPAYDINLQINAGEEYDFLGDAYPITDIDWIIMNPPFATIEPFILRALEIAERGVIMLGRLQFLEGSARYDNIFAQTPPTDVYVYVDRIQCWKEGIKPEGSSAQAYAWFIWNKADETGITKTHWLRRVNSK